MDLREGEQQTSTDCQQLSVAVREYYSCTRAMYVTVWFTARAAGCCGLVKNIFQKVLWYMSPCDSIPSLIPTMSQFVCGYDLGRVYMRLPGVATK